MQIVSWNYRGLGNPKKVEAMKDLLRIEPSDILLLQESNIDEDALLELSKSLWKKNARIAVSSWGTYGGLATVWIEDKFSLSS